MSDSEKQFDLRKVEAVAAWFQGSPRAPFSMELSPVTACNINCRFCRKKDELADYYSRADDLTDDRWHEVISEAVSMGTRKLLFRGGGEPGLKRRLLMRLFPLIRKEGLSCTLLTNGTLIDERMAEGFVLSGWEEIIVSLHGGDSETHDYITDQPGSFDKVDRSLHWVNHFKEKHRSETPRLSFHVVLTRRSYQGLGKVIEFGAKHHVGSIGVFPMHNVPYEIFTRDLKMTAQDDLLYRSLIPGYQQRIESCGMGHDFQLAYQGPASAEKPAPAPALAKPPSAPDNLPAEARLPCYFPWHHAAITPNGFIAPCCYGEGQQTKGDLHRVSFKEAWLAQDMGEVRQTMLQGGLMPYCERCPNWYQDDNRRLRRLFSEPKTLGEKTSAAALREVF